MFHLQLCIKVIHKGQRVKPSLFTDSKEVFLQAFHFRWRVTQFSYFKNSQTVFSSPLAGRNFMIFKVIVPPETS